MTLLSRVLISLSGGRRSTLSSRGSLPEWGSRSSGPGGGGFCCGGAVFPARQVLYGADALRAAVVFSFPAPCLCLWGM